MTYEIQPQDATKIECQSEYVEIRQQDGVGNVSAVFIALDNVDRFCAMVKQCAEEAKKAEA